MSGTGAAVSVGTPGLRAAGRRLVPIVVFGIVPVAAVCLLLADSVGIGSRFGFGFWDFHALWSAGRDVIHGRSPYPPATRAALGGQQAFVYPAPAAVAAVPFALLPYTPASVLFELVSIAALLLALWVVGVRDWRCYGLAFLSRPVLHGLSLGAVTPFLALGLAIAWHWRDRRWVAGGGVAALIVLKVFLWPLLIWLALTRRLSAAATAAALAAVAAITGWAVIGFSGLRGYPHLLDLLSRLLEGKSYSLVALGLSLGTGAAAAQALAAVFGVGCLAVIAWRWRSPEADAWTFTVAIGAALALSPIVWLHYVTLLLVPIAIASPRLSPLWLLPLAFWVVGGQSTDSALWNHDRTSDVGLSAKPVGSAWVIAYTVLVAAIVLTAAAIRNSTASVPDSASRVDGPGRSAERRAES